MESNLDFYGTRVVIPTLEDILMKQGMKFVSSSGNSTGKSSVCHEEIGVNFRILNWEDRAEMMEANGLSVAFAEFDVQDRLSPLPVNPGKAIGLDTTGVLRDHLRQDGRLDYTYSERMWYQINIIVDLLKRKPETRQAFISIWDSKEDITNLESKRVPCSIGFHFLLRNGRLNLVYSMRSLEVTKCLGNDIYTSTRLLEEIAARVGVEVGTVTFSVGSLHILE